MMHHAFEHMPEPHRVLDDVASRLVDHGVVLVRIPVLGHGWRTYGVHWVELDAPRHLYLHSRQSFEELVRRHGFDVVDVSFDSTEMEIWGSEQYAAGVAHRSPRSHEVDPRASMFSPAQIAEYRRTIRELNDRGESGRAAFVLRKVRGAGA
jgi:hypothetical protein